jgi:2-oxoglutarate dehydrogenase E1 component
MMEGYETMEASVPEDGADIARLLAGYPKNLHIRGRRVTPAQYLGLHDTDPTRRFYFGNELATLDPNGRSQWWSLDEVLSRLRDVYCGTLTAEFDHISSKLKNEWVMRKLEGSGGRERRGDGGERLVHSVGSRTPDVRVTAAEAAALDVDSEGGRRAWLSRDDRRAVLRRLVRADSLEKFLAERFPSAKRFGLEGAETLIPGLQAVVEAAAGVGTESIVMGMAHRGRLHVLNAIFGKELGAICSEMKSEGRSAFNVGDVRYHLGLRTTVLVDTRHPADGDGAAAGPCPASDVATAVAMELSLAPNPSHLEAVNAVVAGMVRSKQMRSDPRRGGRSRTSQRKVLGLLLHGDAAFCGGVTGTGFTGDSAQVVLNQWTIVRTGRRMRRVCIGTLVHSEQGINDCEAEEEEDSSVYGYTGTLCPKLKECKGQGVGCDECVR